MIQDRTDSGDGCCAQSTGKVDPQAPGWTKRVRVRNQPPDRAPCLERVGVLEQRISGYADKLGDHVVEPAVGLTSDLLGEAYDFYNLYSWEAPMVLTADEGKAPMVPEDPIIEAVPRAIMGAQGGPVIREGAKQHLVKWLPVYLLRSGQNVSSERSTLKS